MTTSNSNSQTGDIKFVTELSSIRIKAYYKFLSLDRLLTSYQEQVTLKEAIIDLVPYMLDTFNEHCAWDCGVTDLIIRSYLKVADPTFNNTLCICVHDAICEELNIPVRGYRLAYRISGDYIEYKPIKVNGVYEEHLCRPAGCLPLH